MFPTRSHTLLLGGWLRSVHLRCNRRAGCAVPLTAFKRRPLSKRCLNLLSLHLALAVGSVVSSTGAGGKLLL
jgi:hypothetical protein